MDNWYKSVYDKKAFFELSVSFHGVDDIKYAAMEIARVEAAGYELEFHEADEYCGGRLRYDRPATPEEQVEYTERQRQYAEDSKRHELAQLARLQKKYGITS